MQEIEGLQGGARFAEKFANQAFMPGEAGGCCAREEVMREGVVPGGAGVWRALPAAARLSHHQDTVVPGRLKRDQATSRQWPWQAHVAGQADQPALRLVGCPATFRKPRHNLVQLTQNASCLKACGKD